MLATTTDLKRFMNKVKKVMTESYDELTVCAMEGNHIAVNYNEMPFIVSFNNDKDNEIVFYISHADDSLNYIAQNKYTCGNQMDVVWHVWYFMHKYYESLKDNEETKETASNVFEDCKTVKEVMEVKQKLNAQFGKEIFKPSQLDGMGCLRCPADRKGNYCAGRYYCEQTWKRYGAIVNPEWHHVSIATLANIDFDKLDEKRKIVFEINQILKDGIRNLYKCENLISFEVLEIYVIKKCDELIRRNCLNEFWFSYIARQLDEVRRNTIYLYTPYITAHRK
jgi:hypothetical protein